ncbi:hypothetical protein [Streptomyces sp. NPDC048392]|uniref:hypothetical protein n=1 Tax=Streptomyces sp. NPDC048392 TaxID=3365543 RepID=UPI0037212846
MTRKPPDPTPAERAREAQRLAAVGSTRRKAAGLVVALLGRGLTTAGARRVLARRRLPPEIRTAALHVLDELAGPPPEGDAPT